MAKANKGAAPEPADIDTMSNEEFETFKGEQDAAVRSEPEPSSPPEQSAEPAQKSQPKQEEFVPHDQFHRERERRKEAEVSAKRAAERLDELMGLWRQNQPQQPTQAQEQPKGPPDPETDIFAALRYEREQREALQQTLSQQAQAAQQRVQRAQAVQWTTQDIAGLYGENPQAEPAINRMAEAYKAQWRTAGYSPEQISEGMKDYVLQIYSLASQRGERGADLLYRMAVDAGFGGQPQQGQPQNDAKAAMDKMAAREDARQRATSLGGAGAPASVDGPSGEDILRMSPAEYAAFKKKYGPRAIEMVLGNA